MLLKWTNGLEPPLSMLSSTALTQLRSILLGVNVDYSLFLDSSQREDIGIDNSGCDLDFAITVFPKYQHTPSY